MKTYSLINISTKIKNQTIKLLGVLVLHFTGRRYLSVRIDPAMQCNLFCKMCYFSSKEYRKKNSGFIPENDFTGIARVLFPKAFQVYIGCGAEPTTHRGFLKIIELANHYNVPDIGLVTNGQLLSNNQLEKLISLQLNEITISCHGITKETYERFMINAKFDRFITLLNSINQLKQKHHSSKPEIRINYTVNKSNLKELVNLPDLIKNYDIKTLQIRPSLNIGGVFNEQLTDDDIPFYNNNLDSIKIFCISHKVRLLANRFDVTYKKRNINKKVAEAVYCYIGPNTSYSQNVNWNKITFKEFIKITKWRSKTFKMIFQDTNTSINKAVGNYEIFE